MIRWRSIVGEGGVARRLRGGGSLLVKAMGCLVPWEVSDGGRLVTWDV